MTPLAAPTTDIYSRVWIQRTDRKHFVAVVATPGVGVNLNEPTGQLAGHAVEPDKLSDAVTSLVILLRTAVQAQFRSTQLGHPVLRYSRSMIDDTLPNIAALISADQTHEKDRIKNVYRFLRKPITELCSHLLALYEITQCYLCKVVKCGHRYFIARLA